MPLGSGLEHDDLQREILERTMTDAAEAMQRVVRALHAYEPSKVIVPLQPVPLPGEVQWLSLREVAQYLGIAYGTVRQLTLNGTIPSTRIPSGRGSRQIRRVSRTQLEAYLRTRSTSLGER